MRVGSAGLGRSLRSSTRSPPGLAMDQASSAVVRPEPNGWIRRPRRPPASQSCPFAELSHVTLFWSGRKPRSCMSSRNTQACSHCPPRSHMLIMMLYVKASGCSPAACSSSKYFRPRVICPDSSRALIIALYAMTSGFTPLACISSKDATAGSHTRSFSQARMRLVYVITSGFKPCFFICCKKWYASCRFPADRRTLTTAFAVTIVGLTPFCCISSYIPRARSQIPSFSNESMTAVYVKMLGFLPDRSMSWYRCSA
mmetsp:Transcript_124442/g.215672  ORF Transcript_124442/g.215672 Transcript_124442/m.215672 type:complete len:256 (+) Transcript_124442:278-1045(+)